jgi:hypothetical protein
MGTKRGMPIKPENRALYPKDWHIISRAIRDRAEQSCECEGECGLHHGRRCIERNGEPAQFAKGTIVLTVAHLNHTPSDCRDENLKAMCQRCHLRYDGDHHAETRTGQKWLFGNTAVRQCP